ncbi:hypothetical protein K505DRAFT_238999, partial [Melanomma pulvis-pyrius CBS 109.77]
DGRLIKFDLSYSWDVRMGGPPTQHDDLNITSYSPPAQLMGAALFRDPSNDHSLILYGGGVSYPRSSFEYLPPSASTNDTLWTYDTVARMWSAGKSATGLRSGKAPRRGASAEAPELGLAFYLNGVIGDGRNDSLFEEMIIINTLSRETRTVGDMASLDTIWLLDVASLSDNGTGTWYSQKTSGRTPLARADSCLVTATAPDHSSYNIYMLGGISSDISLPQPSIDDVWVLSLPQFVWTQVSAGAKPTSGRACQLVGKRQMLAMGGNCNVTSKRDVPCKPGDNNVVVFEMTTLKWSPLFVKEDKEYRVPRAVYEWIGGDGFGNATMMRPEGDFSNQGLAEMFGMSLGSTNGNSSSTGDAVRLAGSLLPGIFPITVGVAMLNLL